jgi:hypothetical protein
LWPKDISYDREGLRKELLKRKEEVQLFNCKGKPDQGMIVHH